MKNDFFLDRLFEKSFYTPTKTIFIFLLFLVSFFSILFNSEKPSPLSRSDVTDSYQTLLSSLNRGGYSQFINDKNDLRKQIEKVLSNPENEEQENTASNIALYLFPDLLPDSNFEKNTALGLWAPLQAEIEKRPKTPEARMIYEEMKSHIWNYENPKITIAGLSREASDTLQIYHLLSSP